MFATFLVLVVLLGVIGFLSAEKINDSPIIGVFTQPSSSKEGNCNGNCLYVAGSYVKYLEASGARVVPVNYYATNAELDKIFSSVNGFFFPGGSSSFPKTAQYIFDKVVAANDAGDYIPLWGTCMGFQWLLIAASKNQNILDPPSGQMDSYNYSIPLDFTSTAKTSRMFQDAGEVFDILAKENVTMNNHHYGIYPQHFASTPALVNMFDILSNNKDRKGVEFVSTIEAYKYPIFGSQWHPEKNNFEYGKTNGIPNEAINHSAHAALISQYVANFFINNARKNFHAYPTPAEEDAALIYNFAPSKTTGSFMETYFFHF